MLFFKKTYLLILVSGHSDERRLLEDVRAERAVGQLQDVVRSDEMEPRLILMHRVQDRLKIIRIRIIIRIRTFILIRGIQV